MSNTLNEIKSSLTVYEEIQRFNRIIIDLEERINYLVAKANAEKKEWQNKYDLLWHEKEKAVKELDLFIKELEDV